MISKVELQQRSAINRVAALVLVNAMMFQEVLAQKDERVKLLQDFQHEDDPIAALADHWQFILEKINYYPIFHIAHQLISSLSPDVDAIHAIKELAEKAKTIVGWRASLRHDLAGRIYHRLLKEAKYLGAYYTSIPASFLLAKLALFREDWSCDWSNLKEVRALRISDLACGTGTLLMAAADVIVDNHIRESVRREKRPQLNKLHRIIVEKILYGYDVLHSAVHLTASTLALRVPDVPINVTNLSTLPMGGEHGELGSLEFLESPTVGAASLYAQKPERVMGTKEASRQWVTLPQLDLCIMNPPFTSSRQPNLLFGSIPGKDRQGMQKRLKRLVREHKVPASITAGLGSVFVALGDKYLKQGGRLALVLPRALLSGVAWEKTRSFMNQHYRLEYVIVSHEANHWNFSENTDLSEVLVVARKSGKEASARDSKVVCVNLWHNPRNAIEALTLSRTLAKCSPPEITTTKQSQGALTLTIGSDKYGEALAARWSELKTDMWNFPCAFAQSDLVRILYGLRVGRLYLPGRRGHAEVPLCPLGKIGDLGPDPRDVYDAFAFDFATSKTAYPALWGHDTERINSMEQKANLWLEPLGEAREGRKLRKVTDLWPKASRLLLAMRLWVYTKRLVAVRLDTKALSDVWWPLSLRAEKDKIDQVEKAAVVWFNSTVGLLLLLAFREETRGAWIQFKKPVLERMPVLDFLLINTATRKKLVHTFESLSTSLLLPIPNMDSDPTRAAIDEAVASALHLPDFGILRKLLAREPIVCLTMERLSARGSASVLSRPAQKSP
jgi:hypothetical protein